MRLRWLFVLLVSVLLSIPVLFSIWMEHVPLHDVPKIAEDRFWAKGDAIKDDDQIKLFNIQIEDDRIEELKARLATDRLVDPVDDCPLAAARHEFMSNLSKVIPMLTNPVRFGFDFGVKRPLRFEVIVPSLPGFLFSSKSHKSVLGTEIAATVAALYPAEVRGAHLSNPIVHAQFSTQVFFKTLMENFARDEATSSRSEFLERSHDLVPNSELIGDALASSPLGSASYLMSVWSMFSSRDRSQLLNDLFTLDELATVSYLYFLTGTTPHAVSLMRTFMIDELPRQRYKSCHVFRRSS
ncbi:unnamed protein product [Nippostrongylus brasiliensis]|uniref:Epoxide hydrolase 1 (inferred by orthology to a human protein) n=1 Tax=Nippostrongylus brasiliensis TaxID=27835 RepID=A0A0N4YVM7_NIPBR|nr:unnamed protein product [Nippostrongylus brasiliensis]